MWCSYGRRRFESDWNRNRIINIVHMASAQWNRAARTFCTTSDILAYRSQQEEVRNKLLLCLHLQCHNFSIWSTSARLIYKNCKSESIVCVETAPLFSSRLSAELNKARHALSHTHTGGMIKHSHTACFCYCLPDLHISTYYKE